MKAFRLILMLFSVFTITLSCSKSSGIEVITTPSSSTTQFGIFKVLDNKTTIQMDGILNSSSLDNFNKLEKAFPFVFRINIVNCDGANDDDVNLELSKKIHKKGMQIHLLDNATIAFGGVDFFLAGRMRTRGNNTKIGVRSWTKENVTATDFPVGHENHLRYINYYVSVGFTQKQAEDFYYFTINAAPANSVHYMTEEEITQYNLITSTGQEQ